MRKKTTEPESIEYLREHIDSYGPYKDLILNGAITIDVNNITVKNWNDHYDAILNIMRDGIELQYVQSLMITIIFSNGPTVELSIVDYFFNIIMWYLMLRVGDPIKSEHLFFDKEITQNSIKRYIDDYFIDVNRKKFEDYELENIIDDVLEHYKIIDDFAMMLANTVNLEDDITLMKASKGYYDIFHADLSTIPIEDVKDVGQELTSKAVEHMKNSKKILGYDHCLADAFRSQQGVNARQYKEFSINIGSKPDGQGGVFPSIINKSFINGGVADPQSYFIESSTGRTAQILAKMNVGSSGHFARLLGLNNMDSFLNPDPNYVCDSKHFMKLFVEDKDILKMVDNRYYRMTPHGMEKLIKAKKDTDLIGKTIYLRSPITCASAARGHGICYRCYGDLAYTNRNINVGRIASEIVTSKLTQILLSAKHLLETKIDKVTWCPKFDDVFEVEGNIIKPLSEIDYKEYRLLIDPEQIELENEDDVFSDDTEEDTEKYTNQYNEYITEFEVEYVPTGEIFKIDNDKGEKLYISIDLNNVIRKCGEPVEGKIQVELNEVKDISLFFITLQNNELSKTLDQLKAYLNKSSVMKGLSKDELLQSIFKSVIAGNLNVAGVHMETILSNQVRQVSDPLAIPQWEYENEQYEMVTLNTALTNNPSITISLSYQKLPKMLYNPLTYRKHGASFMDLFFMERPQVYLSAKVEEEIPERNEDGLISPIIFDVEQEEPQVLIVDPDDDIDIDLEE